MDTQADDFWGRQFWDLAHKQSDLLHERLGQGEQLKMHASSPPMATGEVRIHYGISNMVVSPKLAEQTPHFHIKQLFNLSSLLREWRDDLSWVYIVSVEETMCLTLSYNSYFTKKEVVDAIVESFMDSFENICEL